MSQVQHLERMYPTFLSDRNIQETVLRRDRPDYEPSRPEDELTSTIWTSVEQRNNSGHYNFERFEFMQLLNLCLLQEDIRGVAKDIFELVGSEHAPIEYLRDLVEKLRPMLKNYNEGLIQVHEIMSYPKASLKTIKDSNLQSDRTKVEAVPLLMADLRGELEQDGVRKLIERLIPDKLAKSDYFSIGPRRELNSGRWSYVPRYTRARAEEHEKEGLKRLVDYLARFFVSIFGGASLLVPMIIMVFSDSRNTNLIITSAFVLFFSIVLSVGSKASNQEILAATAGYAAVLVVFIGTSGTGTGTETAGV
ncbi:hypothetical protein B0A49_01069 [Cryomyces minteri]|uniref:DUF6594 domain-containing protein n=1 Tax=Cryomyces minteri TaxID=331657 RepID=A0A4V5NI68_9PEZI|nr:hypothetical protein B0A49_01069 [Cryomyces minteri]